MQLNEILSIIAKIAKSIGTSTPYICGGVPRDKFMSKISNIDDIDITTGDDTIFKLARATSVVMKDLISSFKTMKDGHSSFIIGNFKIDFSSNYISPEVKTLVNKAGLNNPSDMQLEMYSRDFTVNSLIMTTDFKTIKDPTGLGIIDINRKEVRTCLPPKFTFNNDPRRVVRAFYIAAKLDFNIEKNTLNWIKENINILGKLDQTYVSSRLLKSFKYNEKLTIDLLDETNAWSYIPVTKSLLPYINRKI